VRTQRGARFSDKHPPVRAALIVVSTPDERDFYLHSLMWLVQVEEEMDFEREWIDAKNDEELRQVFLKSWKKRDIAHLEISEPLEEIKDDAHEKKD
jgi:hypothetical protein